MADILNQQGLRSGKGVPFSTSIVARLRKTYGLTDRYTRLRARGLLTIQEMATRMGVTTKTIKHWRQAGLLIGYAYTDKPECLYELPIGNAVPTKQLGRKLSTRPRPNPVIPNRSIEVQHDA